MPGPHIPFTDASRREDDIATPAAGCQWGTQPLQHIIDKLKLR